MLHSKTDNATAVQRSPTLQRFWGHFQLLVLFGCIGLVLVASVHMVGVAVSSQPDCVATGSPGADENAHDAGSPSHEASYIAAKRSC